MQRVMCACSPCAVFCSVPVSYREVVRLYAEDEMRWVEERNGLQDALKQEQQRGAELLEKLRRVAAVHNQERTARIAMEVCWWPAWVEWDLGSACQHL